MTHSDVHNARQLWSTTRYGILLEAFGSSLGVGVQVELKGVKKITPNTSTDPDPDIKIRNHVDVVQVLQVEDVKSE